MKKIPLLIFVFLFFLFQYSFYAFPEENLPDFSQTKSIIFDGKLDRTTPETALKPGSVREVRNMIRPAPGIPVGWKCRGGQTKFNTSAIAAKEIKGIWQYKNAEHDIDLFFVQCDDQIWSSTTTPPGTTANFGTSIYTLVSGTSHAFGEKINDDMVWAATGNTPWAWSGGTAYPDGFRLDYTGGTTLYQNGYEYVRNQREDKNIVFIDSTSGYFYFGYRRRLEAISLDFLTGATNINASGLTICQLIDGTWSGVAGLVDGTADASGVTTCYQSGRISWTYNEKADHSILPYTTDDLFWYRGAVTAALTSGIKVWRVRVHDKCEAITSLWNGQYNIAMGCLVGDETTGVTDYLGEITDGTIYNYAPLDGVGSSIKLYLGFLYPAKGLYFDFPPGYTNQTTSCTMTVKGWDGTAWVAKSVNTVDLTSSNGMSFSVQGVYQWDDEDQDYKRRMGGGLLDLYWYEITFSSDLPSDVRLSEAGQIPRPESIPPFPKYSGVLEYNERAMWWPGNDSIHGVDFSEVGLPHVLMQSGIPKVSARVAFTSGDKFGPGIVNAAETLSVYAIASTRDPLRLYLTQGKVAGKIDTTLISDTVGCIAPHTMKIIEDGIRLFSRDQVMHGVFLMAPNAFYLTNGPSLVNISQPIADYFDTGSTPYIQPEYAYKSYSWIDFQNKLILTAAPVNMENSDYVQTTCNVVFPYSYVSDEWLDIWTYANPPSCGADVIGYNNQRMPYVGDYSGFVHRTNIGDSDNGNSIEHWVKTTQISLMDTLNYQARLMQLRARYKAQTSGNIDVFVYPDGSITGIQPSGVTDMEMAHAGHDMASGKVVFGDSMDLVGESHAIEFRSGTTNVEQMEIHGFTVEFQPDIPTGGP